MVTLRHALLANAVGLSVEGFRIKSVVDIVTEDSVGVPSFPHKMTVNVAFWAKGAPNESLVFSYGVDGPDGSAFRSPDIPGHLGPNGETEGAAQVPVFVSRAGTYSIWLKFGKREVWRRSFSATPIPKSPTIQ